MNRSPRLPCTARPRKSEDSLLSNDLDIDLPARLGLICPDQLGWVAPDLNPDVNVLHRGTVGTTEHATRRVAPGDHQSHTRNDDRSTLTPAAGVWCYASQPVLLRVRGRRFCSPQAQCRSRRMR